MDPVEAAFQDVEPDLPFSGWHDELKSIGTLATKATQKPRVVMTEPRDRLRNLRQRTREHASDYGLVTSQVGEAVLFEAEATLERLEGRHHHEATCYESAATIWLDMETNRFRLNEATLGDAAYKALICSALACAALVADAGQKGDETVSLEAALRDAALAEKAIQRTSSTVGASSMQPTPAASPPGTGGGGGGGEPEPEKLAEKAGRFFGSLRSRVQSKAQEVKAKAMETREQVQKAVSPQRQGSMRRPPGTTGDAGGDPAVRKDAAGRDRVVGASGRLLLPRHAVPHRFRHSTRVHGLLSRLAQVFIEYGCCEVASDLLELAASFVLDEEPSVGAMQQDLMASHVKRTQQQPQQQQSSSLAPSQGGLASPDLSTVRVLSPEGRTTTNKPDTPEHDHDRDHVVQEGIGTNNDSDPTLTTDENEDTSSKNGERDVDCEASPPPTRPPPPALEVAPSSPTAGGPEAVSLSHVLSSSGASLLRIASAGCVSGGGNAELFGQVGLLPGCRASLRHVNRFSTSMLAAATLRLLLQQYERAEDIASTVFDVLHPLLDHHRAALVRASGCGAWVDEDDHAGGDAPNFKPQEAVAPAALLPTTAQLKSRRVAMAEGKQRWVPQTVVRGQLSRSHRGAGSIAAPRPAVDRQSGLVEPRYTTVRQGAVLQRRVPGLFGPVEAKLLLLVGFARVVAAVLSNQPLVLTSALIAAFEKLPTNLMPPRSQGEATTVGSASGTTPRSAGGDAGSPGAFDRPTPAQAATSIGLDAGEEELSLQPCPRSIAALLRAYLELHGSYCSMTDATYKALRGEVGGIDCLGVAVPGGPSVVQAALSSVVKRLARHAAELGEPRLELAIHRLYPHAVQDDVARYLTPEPAKPLFSDSPSPHRPRGGASPVAQQQQQEKRYVDPADLSP